MAHKKAGGSSRNGRDTAGRRLGVKLFGEDFQTLKDKAKEIETVLRGLPGAADVVTEQVTGQPVLEIEVDRSAIARYGIPASEVLCSLADAIVKLSALAVDLKDHVAELDINPLFVMEKGKGVKAADALIRPKVNKVKS